MKVWARLIKFSKLVFIILAVFFLTSCSGIIPQSDIINHQSVLEDITPENEYKTKASSVILEVPYEKYAGVNWCLPASAAMTLKFFGFQISQQELAQKIIKPDGLGDIYKMVRLAKDLGLEASFSVVTIEEIEEYLANQIPLIAIQKYKESNPLAHARVVIGFDADSKEIITNDPTIGKNYTISYEQFTNLNLTSNPKYCMAIIIPPTSV